MIKILRNKSKVRNPYLYEYGYHLINSKNLDNILKNGLKRKIITEKDNYERYVLNNLLYEGKSPVYFFSSLNWKEKISPLLEYEIIQSKANKILKVDIRKFNQLADVPHFLDFSGFLMKIPENEQDSYLYNYNNYTIDDYNLEKIWKKHTNVYEWNRKISIKKFKTDNSLNKDIILYTSTFCIASHISANYIIDVINIK